MATVVGEQESHLGGGRMAVIAPRAALPDLRVALAPWLSSSDDELRARVVLLSGEQAKGLEFDIVVVVDPASMAAEGHHGHRALFVALTRPTQRLVLAHFGELPKGLDEPA